MTVLFTAGLFAFLAAIDADAAPIRPDIRKLVKENQTQPPHSAPARAGWNGPELPAPDLSANPVLDPAVTLRSNKAALMAAAIPDPRAVLAVAVVIFLMRLLRHIQEKQSQSARADAAGMGPKERVAA